MRARGVAILLAILIVIALARIVATWRVYSATFDEPAHLAAGMEWLDHGLYQYEELHAPLARIAAAGMPYLNGFRSAGRPGPWAEGNAILDQQGDPRRALTLARLGILPFFVATSLLVFLWARQVANDTTGLLAVLAFTSVPPVLAHSGVATTDAAIMATVCATVYALVRWLERPSPARTAWLGVAAGLALLAKMSALVFLPSAGGAVLLLWRLSRNRLGPYLERGVAAALIALVVLWGGYRFSVGPLIRWTPPPASSPAPPTPRQRLEALARLPIYPAPAYVRGVADILTANREGRRNYFLGEPIQGGRWNFFPVALAVKTPIPFLLLALVGGATLAVMSRRHPRALAPLVAAGAIFATAMAANINVGVRHILVVYPMLAVAAGLGTLRLWHWRPRRWIGPMLAVGLAAWLVLESLLAHPDYLPYFNQLAGAHPEEVLVDSDLDWGQDLFRLADTLRARGIGRVALAYHGKVDLSRQGLPAFTELPARTPTAGWVAASVFRIKLGYNGGDPDAFAWLRAHTPVSHVGRSINLYWIEPGPTPATAR